MVKVADDIRRLFIGGADGGAELSITMSTQTLVRWAQLTLVFKGAPNTVEYPLVRSFTVHAKLEQGEAIHRIVTDVFGHHWEDWLWKSTLLFTVIVILSDGTAKEWGIYVESNNQEIEVRCGKVGQVSQ